MAGSSADEVQGDQQQQVQKEPAFTPISIPTYAEECAAVKEKLAQVDALIKSLVDAKKELVKRHTRGDTLPDGCVLVWKKDLIRYHSEPRVSHGLSYWSAPKDTKRIFKCKNCKVYYKHGQTENKNFTKHGDQVSWEIYNQDFSCPVCGSSEATYD
mmetsp:Transcript_8499/g.25205  ORF Transcript_8499/g.25205 Transcript_8499/m.25205 type:complete len:156 (-) Transcript_8499:31-498(-)